MPDFSHPSVLPLILQNQNTHSDQTNCKNEFQGRECSGIFGSFWSIQKCHWFFSRMQAPGTFTIKDWKEHTFHLFCLGKWACTWKLSTIRAFHYYLAKNKSSVFWKSRGLDSGNAASMNSIAPPSWPWSPILYGNVIENVKELDVLKQADKLFILMDDNTEK